MVTSVAHPKILVLYKRSSYLAAKSASCGGAASDRFRKNHACHYKSLGLVEQALKDRSLIYRKHCRSRRVDYSSADLIITVGGDGTFLEAARKASLTQKILAVNSDPQWSVGQFCACDAVGFPALLDKMLAGCATTKRLYKLRVSLAGTRRECLNDVLICHANPAAMSRYEIQTSGRREEHRSSGVWVASAAGSTGAIASSGGKEMSLESRLIQYRPRELYHVPSAHYQLEGGIVKGLKIVSRMTHGRIFLDGAHIKFPFKYGQAVEITSSPSFVNLIHV